MAAVRPRGSLRKSATSFSLLRGTHRRRRHAGRREKRHHRSQAVEPRRPAPLSVPGVPPGLFRIRIRVVRRRCRLRTGLRPCPCMWCTALPCCFRTSSSPAAPRGFHLGFCRCTVQCLPPFLASAARHLISHVVGSVSLLIFPVRGPSGCAVWKAGRFFCRPCFWPFWLAVG